MQFNDNELQDALAAAEMDVRPDAQRAAAVRDRLTTLSSCSKRGGRPLRVVSVLALVLVLTAGGIAATESGRALLRDLLTPIGVSHATEWVAPDGSVFVHSRDVDAYTDAERLAAEDQMSEIYQLRTSGAGKLVGLIESPGFFGTESRTIYTIEYTLSDGTRQQVGGGRPTGQQAENLRIDELMALRDAGEGEIIEQHPFAIGLGRYVLRFRFTNGQTVDLSTQYPPSTAAEREAIFDEMRVLYAARDFTVLDPRANPDQTSEGIVGLLQYTLADGRTVGATQRVPDDLISEDGRYVIQPLTAETTAIDGRP